MQIPVPVATVGLLVLSNVFMTFAWYGHLKHKSMALPMVIFISWCIFKHSIYYFVPFFL